MTPVHKVTSKRTKETKPPLAKIDPISHVKITINDNEEVEVDSRSTQRAFINDVSPLGDAVFKCSNPKCAIVTVHEGHQFEICHTDSPEVKPVRVYLCTNCGKFGTK